MGGAPMWLKRRKRDNRRLMPIRDQKDPARGIFTRRALLCMAVQVGALGELARRLYHIQINDGDHYARMAANNRVSKRLLAPPRGRIVDRYGIALANNKENWRALLMPEETTDVPGTIERFSALIPLDERDRNRIARELRHQRRFVPVMLRDFLSWDEMARIELNAPSCPVCSLMSARAACTPKGNCWRILLATSPRRTRAMWHILPCWPCRACALAVRA